MKNYLLFFLTLTIQFCVMTINAQNKTNADISKINKKIDVAKNQEAKIDAINVLGNYWFNSNYDSAVYYYEKAYKISRKINYKKGLFDYSSNTGNVYVFQGKYDKLKILMLSSVKLAKDLKDKHHQAIFITNLGNAYMYNAEYEKAIENFQKGKQLFRANNEPKYERKINTFISICFLNSGNFDKSIEYANKAYILSEKVQDSATTCTSLSILGKVYVEKKDFFKAKFYIEKALIFATNLKMGNEIADAQYDKSRILFSEGKYKNAIYWCNKSIKYYDQTGNITSKVNGLCSISDYYLKNGDKKNALASIKNAEDLATKKQLKSHLLLVYTSLANLNKGIENYKEAFQYLEKNQLLNDSLNSENLKNKLQELDTKFQTAEKDKNILLLGKSQYKQRTFIYTLVSIVMGLLLFSFLLFRNFNARKKINEQEIRQLQQGKKIDAAQNMLQGEESERTRLARDLHDGLGGMLTGVKFQLNSMKGNVILSEENAETFTRSISQLDNAIAEMRRVAHNMMPEALLKFGLNDTLKNYCDSVSQNSGLAISFQSFGMENRLEQTTEIVIYRVVQELLNNTLKHANATNVYIQLSRNENTISLTVEDDGKGFDVSKVANSGIGLSNIQHRVDYLNGKMDIKSDDKGTSTHIEFEIA